MMKSQYDIERMKFSDLNGSVALPSYQRKLVWTEGQKSNFIDNISKGYPFGSILLYRYEGKKELSLIDGLQRFSALREYNENPAKYFTNYEPHVQKILGLIESGNEISLSPDQKGALSEQITALLKSMLTTSANEPLSLRNMITDGISIYPSKPDYLDELVNLQSAIVSEASDFLDLDDLMIPCIIFTGSEEQLPDVFSNLNRGGTKLSKYQVLAAQWTSYLVELPDSTIGKKLINKVIQRYRYLINERELEILDFDPAEMESSRVINLSEFCYAVGELIIEECPAFWTINPSDDLDKKENTVNVLGYLSVAISLSVDNRKISNLISKMTLLQDVEFAEKLTTLIIKEFRVLNNVFEQWLRIPGANDTARYENALITELQILSYFASLWHKRYVINEENKTIEDIPNYKDKGYEQIRQNLVSYCISDIVSQSWRGSGDSRLASYYSPGKDAYSSYYSPISRELLESRLLTWLDDAMSKPSLNIERISRFLLCIHAAPNRNKYTGDNYDVEHVIAKHLLKTNDIYQKEDIPGGTLGNLMYLKEKTNRSKKYRNLYSLLDHEGIHFDEDYLKLTLYPSRTSIDTAEDELAAGNPEKVKSLIKNRAKEMIHDIAKSIRSSC